METGSVSKLTERLKRILDVQEMTTGLLKEQRLLHSMVDNQYKEEVEENRELLDKESLLNREFLYGNLSLHNLHKWIGILKVIFVLLTIIVLYLIIFKHKL